jgi:hypothetical protein
MLIASLFAGTLAVLPVGAALTQKELEAKITDAKILQPGDKISSAKVRGEEVLVTKNRSSQSKDPEKDCKIDAVLISKVVMTADPSVKRVRVRFVGEKEPSRYWEVLVREVDIKAFAAGAVSQADLLSSLDINHGTVADPGTAGSISDKPQGAPPVAAGPQQQERAALLDRINELGERGVNTQPYMKQFSLLEDTAKSQDKNATADALDKLTVSVSDQEKALSSRGQRKAALPSTTPATQTGSANPPAAAKVDEDGERKSELSDIHKRLEKVWLGGLSPADGPYKAERSVIGSRISTMEHFGKDMHAYREAFKQLNYYAKRNEAAKMTPLVNNCLRELRISAHEVKMAKGMMSVLGE